MYGYSICLSDFETVLVEFIQCWYGSYSYRNVFLGAIQLVFLGFMGEYILSMNQRIMHRPLVIEQERINFD